MCVCTHVCGERVCVILIDVFPHTLLVCFLTDLVRSSHCCERREREKEEEKRERERIKEGEMRGVGGRK